MIAFLRGMCSGKDIPAPRPSSRGSSNGKKAAKQLNGFAKSLSDLGLQIEWIEPSADSLLPMLLADTAIPLPDAIVLARPADASAVSAVESASQILAKYRPVVRILEPALIEGRDVIRIGRTLFVGLTSATNSEAVSLLAESVEPFGFSVRPVELKRDGRLKAACSFIPPRFLVVNPDWLDPATFG